MTSTARRFLVPCLLVAMCGCGVATQSHPTRLDEHGVEVVAPTLSAPLPPGTPTERTGLCLISGHHLATFTVDVPLPLTVRHALGALVAAAKGALPAGTRSAINNVNLLTAGPTTRGVAQVELSGAFADILPADQILALAQVVCTLTDLPGVGQVRFTRAGQPIEIPRADGSLTSKPVSRFDYMPLLPTS